MLDDDFLQSVYSSLFFYKDTPLPWTFCPGIYSSLHIFPPIVLLRLAQLDSLPERCLSVSCRHIPSVATLNAVHPASSQGDKNAAL
jgi:hypothetical protein